MSHVSLVISEVLSFVYHLQHGDEFHCIQHSPLHLKGKSKEETTSHWSGEHRRLAIYTTREDTQETWGRQFGRKYPNLCPLTQLFPFQELILRKSQWRVT